MFVGNSTYYLFEFLFVCQLNKVPSNESLNKCLMIITPYELFMIVQGNLYQGEVGVGAFIEITDDICNFET